MTEDLDRLRAADPASDLPADDRAEQDLQVLLTQSRRSVPTGSTHRGGPRRAAVPVLVTAAVAAVVLLGSAVVLGAAQRRSPAAPASSDTAPPAASRATPPPEASDACRPTAVHPLQCGTYRSTFGGARISGSTGDPVEDPLQISFTAADGRLVLLADSGDCWSAEVPMRFVEDTSPNLRFPGRVAERAGAPRFTTSGCASTEAVDEQWASAFLRSALRTADGRTFGRGDTAVFFEYRGAAPIGRPQLARNDETCVPAHVAPFRCGSYRSVGGSGTLAFLGTRPFRLRFAHRNGELEAGLLGRCNAVSTALQTDGDRVVATGGGSTTMGCSGTRGSDDSAVSDFFHGVLTVEQREGVLTFSSPSGSATFAR